MTNMVTFHVPENPNWLIATGKLAVVHSHHEHILKMMVKSLCCLEVDEALSATNTMSAREIREYILKISKNKFNKCTFLKVKALMEKSKLLSEARNEILHSPIAKELDNDKTISRNRDNSWRDLPEENYINEIVARIEKLTKVMNDARLEGFIFKALEN